MSAALAGIALRVGVGSASEAEGQRGLAHLVEHLVAASVDVRYRSRVRAETSRGCTLYRLHVLPAHVEDAVESLRAALREPVITAAALERESRTIAAEYLERSSNPSWRAQDALLSAWWEGTSWAQHSFGDVGALVAVGPSVTEAAHRAWYARARLTLAVSAADGRSRRAVLRDGTAGPAAPWFPASPAFGGRWRDEPSGALVAGVAVAIPSPARDGPALDLGLAVLGQHGTTKLARHEEAGLTLLWCAQTDASPTELRQRVLRDVQRAVAELSGSAGEALVARARVPVLTRAEDLLAEAKRLCESQPDTSEWERLVQSCAPAEVRCALADVQHRLVGRLR